MRDGIVAIFQQSFRELRPGSCLPPLTVEFFAFANVNNTIRLREGKLHVRLSDLLEGAPEPVLRALAHILLAKMYRKPIERSHATRYRRYVHSHEIRHKAHLVRQVRGRKRIASAQGRVYDLDKIFTRVNRRYFNGRLHRPALSWSARRTKRILGHHDAVHDAIIISRSLDQPDVPEFLVEYVLYHEMLHIKHRPRIVDGRRLFHTAAFRADEQRFARFDEAMTWFDKFARRR